MKRLLKLFNCNKSKSKKPEVGFVLTCGKPDEHGIANTYLDGEKTNVRVLIFNEEQAKRL